MKYWNGPEGVYYNPHLNEILYLEHDCFIWQTEGENINGVMYWVTRADGSGHYPKRYKNCVIPWKSGKSMTHLGVL